MIEPTLLLTAVLLGTPAAPAGGGQAPAPCRFEARAPRSPALVVGPPELVARTFVVDQPGSPVAVLAVDLEGTTVSTAGGRLEHQTTHTIDIQNVSDRMLAGVRVSVQIRSDRGGSGGGAITRAPLEPGGTAQVTGRGGGSGSGSENGDFVILVLVESVQFDDCVYTPARVMPLSLGGVPMR